MPRNIQPIRPAATVMLVRPAAAGIETFMLRRTSTAAFAGGMYVFPGGRVDGDDHLNSYAQVSVGPTEQQELQRKALGYAHHGYWVAGIRESFEEAGLLLAYDQTGELVRYDTPERARRFAAMREPLHAGTLSLFEICVAENLRLAIDAIHFHNRVVTPLGRPRRFDTRFFVAEAPAGQTGVHDDFETVASVWVSPQEALRRHADQEFGLMRVTQMQLEELAQHRSCAALLSAAAARSKFSVLRPKLPQS